jgi:hypothetical protein
MTSGEERKGSALIVNFDLPWPQTSGTIHPSGSWFGRKECLMMIYQDKISPPLVPSDEEQMKLVTEAIASEDRWAKGLVGRIALVIREIQKH